MPYKESAGESRAIAFLVLKPYQPRKAPCPFCGEHDVHARLACGEENLLCPHVVPHIHRSCDCCGSEWEEVTYGNRTRIPPGLVAGILIGVVGTLAMAQLIHRLFW